MADQLTPFDIAVPDDVLADLRHRLSLRRAPDQMPDQEWVYGTERDWLEEICAYWADDYDWRATEKRLNGWENVTTTIDGTNVHALVARSPHDEAMPLVITHGWPGSVVEFLEVIDPLRDPTSHGGDAADAFHVVCPSMPGYGWSGPTVEPGWDPKRIARAWAVLMERLGFQRYGAQGGDWGSMITAHLAVQKPAGLVGIHLNMVIALPPANDPNAFDGLDPDELEALGAAGEFMTTGIGYQEIQGTKPQTLGYALNDSPYGLAGWIGEKLHAWTDNDGSVDDALTRQQVCDNLTTYWVTRTINSSMRLYYEAKKADTFGSLKGDAKGVPMGAAIFPAEIIRPPRKWAEAMFDVVHWSKFDRGGHFAAWEEPDLYVEDVRTFFRPLR